jgi:hypothetical protein
MSRANSVAKVLRTALKRVQKGWTKGSWHNYDDDGNHTVCLEGALFGYCQQPVNGYTKAQIEARDLVLSVIKDRFGDRKIGAYGEISIPDFNDHPETVLEEVMEVIKLAIIRDETGYDPEDDYIDLDEVDELFPKKGG